MLGISAETADVKYVPHRMTDADPLEICINGSPLPPGIRLCRGQQAHLQHSTQLNGSNSTSPGRVRGELHKAGNHLQAMSGEMVEVGTITTVKVHLGRYVGRTDLARYGPNTGK